MAPDKGDVLQSLQLPGYGSPQQLLSCPAPGSDPANSLSLINLQSQVAEQVVGKPVSAANPNIERAGDTGMAAGSVADAAAGTTKAVGTAGKLAKLGKVAKVAGPVGTVVATGAQVVETGLEIRDVRRDPNLSQAEKQQKAGKAAVVGAGKLLGGTGGLVGGMALGLMVGGPVGMVLGVIGGVAGGFGGDWVGGKAGEALGDTVVGRTVGKLFN
ncbi:hypothetical protein IV102_21145 [bacterium]|nr:hypothetical protein [bacterium]